ARRFPLFRRSPVGKGYAAGRVLGARASCPHGLDLIHAGRMPALPGSSLAPPRDDTTEQEAASSLACRRPRGRPPLPRSTMPVRGPPHSGARGRSACWRGSFVSNMRRALPACVWLGVLYGTTVGAILGVIVGVLMAGPIGALLGLLPGGVLGGI